MRKRRRNPLLRSFLTMLRARSEVRLSSKEEKRFYANQRADLTESMEAIKADNRTAWNLIGKRR